MQKTCTQCGSRKGITHFQKNGRGGYRPKCKDCIKAVRSPYKVAIEPIGATSTKPMKIVGLNAYDTINEKYPGFKCLVFGNGEVRLQIHGNNPNLHFCGRTPEEVLRMAAT